MRTLLNIVALLALAFWIGSELFFGGVLAPSVFGILPPMFADHAQGIHAAGAVVGTAIARLHYLGIVCGIAFLLVTFMHSRLHSFKHFFAQAGLVVVMLLLTSYSQFSVIPRMDTARQSAGGIVAFATPGNPAHEEFERLHAQSTRVEGGILLCGLLAFCFAVKTAELPPRILR